MCEKVSAILGKKGGPRREEAQKAPLPSPPSRKRKLPPLLFQARDPRPGGDRPQSRRCLASRAGCLPRPRGRLVPHLPTCRSRGRSLGHLAAAGAACALPWRRAPGLVARRQSPKALWLLERERLEPPTFQGSLPYCPSAREAQVGALGVSRTNGWGRSQGRSDLGLEGLIWGAGEGGACP